MVNKNGNIAIKACGDEFYGAQRQSEDGARGGNINSELVAFICSYELSEPKWMSARHNWSSDLAAVDRNCGFLTQIARA
jgi:hypothetical protein